MLDDPPLLGGRMDTMRDLARIFDDVVDFVARFFARIYLSVTRFVLSFRQIKHCHLGTRVIYKEEVWTIYQFSRRGNRYIYKISRGPRQFRHNQTTTVTSFDVYKERSVYNLIHDALYWWNWYKRNWLGIDIRSLTSKGHIKSIEILGWNLAHGKEVDRQ